MEVPGQVSYRPVDGAEAGDLYLNRVTEQPPRYQQLTSFEQWFPPTRTSCVLPPATTFSRNKSQRNWLYKTHPEAFLGNLGLPGLITAETRAQKEAPDTQTASVLAVGEILDLRNNRSSRTEKCPVVALIAGEAGHILHLTVINPERWSWNNSTFALGAPQAKFQGSWYSDGSPISKIGFATKLKQYDNLRWLIVQKETSTTIFAPELRAKPVAAATSMSATDATTAEYIVLDPVVTLTMDVTGGESHSDFSINLGSDDVAPQLAIIDRSGNWSVWRIGREGHGRSKTNQALLIRKGNSTLPVTAPSDQSYLLETYKIAWTSRSNPVGEWERDDSPPAHDNPPGNGSQATYPIEPGLSCPKYDGLLISNQTQLQMLDMDGGKPRSLMEFSKRDGADSLLDAQTFPELLSTVLVLTTDKLYLLDVSLLQGQAKSPSVIASCRHFRNSPRETLQMSVTKLTSSSAEANLLVSIHSAQSFRVDLIWVITRRDGTAKFHRQVVHFPGLNSADAEDLQGIRSLTAVPLPLGSSKGKDREYVAENLEILNGVRLYQLYVLTTNLSLSAAIVAMTQGDQQDLPTPVKWLNSWWTDERRVRFLRRKWLRETEQAFVIPDRVEEVRSLSIARTPIRVDKQDTIQLRPYMLKLVQEINHAFFPNTAGGSVKLNGAEYVQPIREALESREEGDYVSLKPLLGFSDLWKPFEISALEDEVNYRLRRLKKSQDLRVFGCGTYGPGLSAMDVFEKMSIDWSSALTAEALRPSQWRYMEVALERMAAEVYLSEQGVYMAPQSALDLAAKCLPQEGPRSKIGNDLDSQPRSSQATPIPSAAPSSSRATSEAFASSQNSQNSQGDEAPGQEDPAVARLRLYLPSIKFTPPPKNGPSRIISLWPEERGVDPSTYRYKPPGQDQDERLAAAKRRREKDEDRRQRRAKKRALLGIKMEGEGESFSQPFRSMISRSSPPLPMEADAGSSQPQTYSQDVAESSQPQARSQPQAHSSQSFGGLRFGSQRKSQSMSFAKGFGSGASQTMSQPLPGEFGGRSSKKSRKKGVGLGVSRAGFK